jgi:hypothetical protein
MLSGQWQKPKGLEATDEAALRRMDRRRSKKGSNAEWITRMNRKPRSWA